MELCEQLDDEHWWTLTAAISTRFLVGLGQLAEARALELRAREKAERLQDVYTGPLLAWQWGINCSDLWDIRGALSGYLAELSTTRASRSPFRTGLLTESSHMHVQVGEMAEARRVLAQMRGSGASTALPWEDGDWARNQSDITTKIELARRDGNLDSVCLRTHWLGFMARMHGRYEESEALQKESLEISRKAPNLPRVLWSEEDLCLLYFDMRRREDARRSLEICRNILAQGEDWKGIEGGVARAQAVVAALDRRFSEADTQFEKAVDILRRYSVVWTEAQTHRYWGRVLISAGDTHRATEKLQAAIEIYRRIGAGQPWIDDVTAELNGRWAPQAAPATVAVARIEKSKCTFRREGEYWTLSYQGDIVRLRDAKGLHYIAHLLRHAGQQVPSIELAALTANGGATRHDNGVVAVASSHITSDLGDAGQILDPKAIAQYKRRREDLREELERAIDANDLGAQQRARAESDALAQQLSAATGIGGQLRKAASHRERARVRVNKRIQTALENIRAADISMGRHLANSIQTGHSCCYSPAEPVSWQL